MLALYTFTIFVSATLLFMIEPMFARMVTPVLGGSSSVWNTAVVFYQITLLLGYIYAHIVPKRLGIRRQAMLHLVLIFLPLLVLPIKIPFGWNPPTAGNPIPWLLALLSVAIGLPFFILSTSSPLLQKWFANTGHQAAADPYFLYVASNIGSMLALVSYPTLIEPLLRLREQSMVWSIGYGLLMILTIACTISILRSTRLGPAKVVESAQNPCSEMLSFRRRITWVLLAFVPSSLMLSVTTYTSTNIAPIPLLWVIPLAIYLLTFIFVFASRPFIRHTLIARALPIILIPLIIAISVRADRPFWILIPLHLLTFFVIAMYCHGEIAGDRPHPDHLTEFYLWMSLGGALGGIFNALLAPILFNSVAEYPLVLILACFLLPRVKSTLEKRASHWLDLAYPLGLGSLVVGILFLFKVWGLINYRFTGLILLIVIAVVSFAFSRRPTRFALAIGILFLVGSFCSVNTNNYTVYAERSFFGISRVAINPAHHLRVLFHGNTLHGMQSLEPDRHRTPLTYYYPTGPIGQVFTAFNPANPYGKIAVVGLGTGSLACYRQSSQEMTFFEIDPTVARIAQNPRYFSFLKDFGASVVLGDARLSLAKEPDGKYGMIVLDAYSSDSIPVHLLTREAIRLYLQKLAPRGLLAFHITNRYLDLQPVLGNLAHDAGLVGLIKYDIHFPAAEADQGKFPSRWVVIARTQEDLNRLSLGPLWHPLQINASKPVWTDDYSSILSVLHW